MENEDEEASKLTNPSVQVEDDSNNFTATAATVTDSNDAVQGITEPQCESEAMAELSESLQLTSEEQSLGDGKELLDDEFVEKSEAVAELDESKFSGGDESRDSEPVVTAAVVGEEDGDVVANTEDVVNGGDLVVPSTAVGGGEVAEEDVIDEGETEGKKRVNDVAEAKEEKAEVFEEVDVGAEIKGVDVADEEKEIVGEQKGDDVTVEAQIENENETKVDDVKEAKGIVDEQKGDIMAAEAQTEDEMKVDNVAAELRTEDEKKVDNVAEETGIVDDLMEERAEIAGNRETVGCPNVVDVTEETETADETKAVDVAVVAEGRAEIAEDSEIAGETKVVDVAADKEKEIKVADLAKETMSYEEKKVADVTVTETEVATIADEIDVGNVAEETEVQEEEMEFTNVAGGEAEVEEEMEKAAEETEILEVTETDEMEMGDVGEETMEVGANIGDEMEKAETAEEMGTGDDVEEVSTMVGGKRKRVGKNSKSPGKAPSKKKSEEDVCFICFDGGDLVLCDRRGCPKAYHPSCVNRDEAFFRAKGRWNCGWHLCSICEKNAYYMCYTCTFSLCKGCTKDAVILCVRGNKGFCETCMKTVMLIERNEQGNKEMAQVDFDDKNSWEYLFKDYWLDLKVRLSLSSDELARAKNPWKGSDTHAGKQSSPDELYDANVDGGHGSDSSSGNAEATVSKRRKAKKRSKSRAKDEVSPGTVKLSGGEGASTDGSVEWASKELLDLVMHMRNGDKSALSQFDVQTLLLEYIKKYKLRDPQRRTHVICDARLQNLFGKPRVGHFEMLKLLESHFLTKEDSQVDELQGSVVDTEANLLEADGSSDALVKGGKDKKRKTRKKGDHRGLQSNVDDYAAIDMHNINLIYLRRNFVEELLEDTETFHDKVVGTFARIRISGSAHQKQDLYRLVQVTGTSKGTEPYKVGKRTTDILLEILNLNKTEVISIDIISNQEFTEDECKRLRQSIKCGLINRLTVGDIQEKAMALQEVRVKDWMEAEILRLSHLRDRASDLGRRKELRECVEKLQLLKTPEERQRRLEEIPEIHSDPNMDPSYESEEDDGETDDKRQDYMRPRGSGFSRRGREPISPGKGGSFSNDSLSGTRNYSGGIKDLTRNISNKGFSNKGDDLVGGGEIVNESLWNQARDRETEQFNSWDKPRTALNLETGARNNSVVLSESISRAVAEKSPASASTGVTQSAPKINESEKIWHYQDPSGKVQGPFSMVQLRKWNNTGYFPANLRIWRSNEKQDDSILLTDALAGKFHKDPRLVDISLSQTIPYSGKSHGAPSQPGMETPVGGSSNFDQNRTAWNQHGTPGSSGQSGTAPSLELPKQYRDGWASETNLPSPTPTQSTAGEIKGKTFEKEWSPTPNNQPGSLMVTNLFPGNVGKQSPPATGLETGQSPIFSASSSASKLSVNVDGLNITHGVTSASKPETVESQRVLISPHQLPASSSVVASVNPGVDIKSIGANLQTLVQSVSANVTPVESHAWGSGLAARPEMMAPSPKPVTGAQGWGSASSQKLEPNNPVSMPAQSPAYAQPYASTFNTGNSPGVFPVSGQSGMPASDSWRAPVPSQSNVQSPAQPITPWGMGVAGNQSAVPRQGPESQNTGWGQMPPNPSMGWGGQLPASTNMNWGAPAQGQAPGNAHSGWAGPAQGQAHKNAVPGWAPPGQGPSPVNANTGWVAPGQGPPPGNGNPGWGAPAGNPVMWGSDQNNGGDRFPNQRDRGSHGGDSGYGGGRPWNRQPSFGSRGGDSSRPHFNKGQRVCKFHESGHCKKGSQCDYLHT